VAVCGLSPHAGEGGLFGREEIEEIQPAMRDGAAAGIAVQGRLPADTVFSMMVGGPFDLVVAMDHDQGHIPTKLTGFRYDEKAGSWLRVCGVNVTLGLPIVRTSVDHGTAFGKAGLGRANPQSMIQTIEMAVRLTGGTAD
jgi:4-hydroxythreonine-4-phosphate dehydrogenase